MLACHQILLTSLKSRLTHSEVSLRNSIGKWHGPNEAVQLTAQTDHHSWTAMCFTSSIEILNTARLRRSVSRPTLKAWSNCHQVLCGLCRPTTVLVSSSRKISWQWTSFCVYDFKWILFPRAFSQVNHFPAVLFSVNVSPLNLFPWTLLSKV